MFELRFFEIYRSSEYVNLLFDGILISNGPGNPTFMTETIEHVKEFINSDHSKPIFGICLGHQVLALAAGASIYKMKYGNRSMNQPVIDLRTQRCYITPQNHGYAVDENSLKQEMLKNVAEKTGSQSCNVELLLKYKIIIEAKETCKGITEIPFHKI